MPLLHETTTFEGLAPPRGAIGPQNAAQMGKVRAKVGHRSRLSVRVMDIMGARAEIIGNHLETVRKSRGNLIRPEVRTM